MAAVPSGRVPAAVTDQPHTQSYHTTSNFLHECVDALIAPIGPRPSVEALDGAT
jgi:hypothetical protein